MRLAREAEAAMDYHVNKAAEKAVAQERKHPRPHPTTHEDAPTGMPPAFSCPDGFDCTSHHDDHGAEVDKNTTGHKTEAPPTNFLD